MFCPFPYYVLSYCTYSLRSWYNTALFFIVHRLSFFFAFSFFFFLLHLLLAPVRRRRPAAAARTKVVANAVAALSEIGDTSGRDVMEIDTSVLQKLLAALNECTEWGQVIVLDATPQAEAYPPPQSTKHNCCQMHSRRSAYTAALRHDTPQRN